MPARIRLGREVHIDGCAALAGAHAVLEMPGLAETEVAIADPGPAAQHDARLAVLAADAEKAELPLTPAETSLASLGIALAGGKVPSPATHHRTARLKAECIQTSRKP